MRRLFVTGMVAIVALTMFSHGASAGWKTVCDDKLCQLHQNIVRQTDNQLITQLFFQKVPKEKQEIYKNVVKPGSIYGVLLLPLGLHIPSGVKVSIDDKLSFDAELISCKPAEGCRAIFATQTAMIEFMKKGAKFVVEIVDAQSGRSINFTFFLNGFSKAFDEFLQKPI